VGVELGERTVAVLWSRAARTLNQDCQTFLTAVLRSVTEGVADGPRGPDDWRGRGKHIVERAGRKPQGRYPRCSEGDDLPATQRRARAGCDDDSRSNCGGSKYAV
jgi:hypothetical protein